MNSLAPFTGIPALRSSAKPSKAYACVQGRRVMVCGVTALLVGVVDNPKPAPEYRRHHVE